MPELSRRGLFLGLGATIIAAPAIVRAASLMPVRGIVMDVARLPGIPASILELWAVYDLQAELNINFRRLTLEVMWNAGVSAEGMLA